MDTKELERFCPWARQELVDAVMRGMVQLGVDEAGRAQWPAGSEAVAGRALSPEARTRRDRLMAGAAAAGDAAFAEREAYSWFNRLMALRYMELHGLLPWGGRALSTADGSFNPELATRAANLPLASLDRAAYLERAAESDDEGAFRLALEAACAELAGALPGVFEGASCDLLPKGLLARGEHNVIQHLVEDVSEDSWEDVEALGWAYQFYNSERKDEFFKSKRKAAAEDIAPATQLFTPDWIVRYMVQNSLGRLWMLNNPESPLKQQMEFYIEPDAEHEDFLRISGPEEITFCDPACGSGHILVYAFQLLTEMYRERGWRDRDIARSILESNLSGYEIDPRAAQIAQTALCMEALALDRRWLSRGVAADVRVLGNIELDEEQLPETYVKRELADAIRHLSEVGSLLDPSPADLAALDAAIADAGAADLLGSALRDQLQEARGQLGALSRRFDVVAANPPYMGSSSFNPFVAKWIKKRYPNEKAELCTCFIKRASSLCKNNGYAALVTMQSWLFSSTYEAMRKHLFEHTSPLSMAHIGSRGFDSISGEIVSTVAFSMFNCPSHQRCIFFKITQPVGETAKSQLLRDSISDSKSESRFCVSLEAFHGIPGAPLAYWAGPKTIAAFAEHSQLKNSSLPLQGLATTDNDRFLRFWWEPATNRSSLTSTSREDAATSCKKWFPHCKGGSYRKWYGNRDYLINWEHDGDELHSLIRQRYGSPSKRIVNADSYFLSGITYSDVSTGMFSSRVCNNSTFDVTGPVLIASESDLLAILACLNSSCFQEFLILCSPGLHYRNGVLANLPAPISVAKEDSSLLNLCSDCIAVSKADYDSQETSWDFKRSPLL